MRDYVVGYYVNDDFSELEFQSDHRRGSKANLDDAKRAIRMECGKYIYDRAEIINIYLGTIY